MSTNFYHRFNECECCGRYDERHIGKRSGGWEFSFRAYTDEEGKPFAVSWQNWKAILKKGRIFDEYGKEVTYDEFVADVEESKGKTNHYDYVKGAPQYREYGMDFLRGEFKDSEGWSFSGEAFS